MFSRSPSNISLLPSIESDPFAGPWLAEKDHTDGSLIHLLNDEISTPAPPSPVLHIQSPALHTTFIRCPSVGSDLHIKHPWLHIQVKQLLGHEWSFEVGIVDHAGREGIIRCSTFEVAAFSPFLVHYSSLCLPQDQPSLKLSADAPPLLHLPLTFPSASSLPLTSWCSVDLNVATYLPPFSASNLLTAPSQTCPLEPMQPVPSGTFSHISYIKVYASCKLRRIWLSETWPSDQQVP